MKEGSRIKLGVHEYAVILNGLGYFLKNKSGGYNDTIFSELGIYKESFTRSVLGYYISGGFPHCRTLQDLQKLVKAIQMRLSSKSQMKTYTVTREQFIKGYELACSDWKEKLRDQLAVKFAFQDTVEVSEELVNELRRAASNSKQKSFIEECFGSSNTISSLDLKVGEAMRIVEQGTNNGTIILRIYDSYVDIDDPNSTWDEEVDFIGVKVNVEIKVTD
jgi:hypothetical protein